MEKDNIVINKEKSERVSIFIDGSNFYNSTAKKGIRINFEKLVKQLIKDRKLVNTFYYVAPLDFKTNPKKYWKHQKFLNKLREISKFNVVLCNLKKIKKEGGNFEFVIKEDDVYLTVDLISGAYENLYDTAIIVSGDEDFIPAIKKLKQLGKKIENAYFISSSSSALKHTSNTSICLNNIIKEIL